MSKFPRKVYQRRKEIIEAKINDQLNQREYFKQLNELGLGIEKKRLELPKDWEYRK